MTEAFINGQRKTSADAEFCRCVKNNLKYRMKWDNQFKPADKTQRASDGCSRWHPGRHFPSWEYGVPGVLDPGYQGFLDHVMEKEGGIGRT
eukprot:5531463-Heterocapsa_arctica.AAC.1